MAAGTSGLGAGTAGDREVEGDWRSPIIVSIFLLIFKGQLATLAHSNSTLLRGSGGYDEVDDSSRSLSR